MDSYYNRPDTTYGPQDPDANKNYAEGHVLRTTVWTFVAPFMAKHPEAVVTDAWHSTTRYFIIRSPETAERFAKAQHDEDACEPSACDYCKGVKG